MDEGGRIGLFAMSHDDATLNLARFCFLLCRIPKEVRTVEEGKGAIGGGRHGDRPHSSCGGSGSGTGIKQYKIFIVIAGTTTK